MSTVVAVLAAIAVVSGLLVAIPARAEHDQLGLAVGCGAVLAGAWVLVLLLAA